MWGSFYHTKFLKYFKNYFCNASAIYFLPKCDVVYGNLITNDFVFVPSFMQLSWRSRKAKVDNTQMHFLDLWPSVLALLDGRLGTNIFLMLLLFISRCLSQSRSPFRLMCSQTVTWRLVWRLVYTFVNRLDLGQLPSNSVAGLRSNLVASHSIIPKKNRAEFQGF